MSDDSKRMQKCVADLVQMAADKGALASEVLAEQQETCTLRSVGAANDVRWNTGCRLHIRAFCSDGRLGWSVADMENWETGGEAVLESALAHAEEAAPKEITAPAERMAIVSRGMALEDPRRATLTDEDRVEVIHRNHDACRTFGDRVRPGVFSYREKMIRRAIATSRGIKADEVHTRFSLKGVVFDAQHPDITLGGWVESRVFADVASKPLGRSLGNQLLASIATAALPEERSHVVLSPRAVARLLPLLVTAFHSDGPDGPQGILQSKINTQIGAPILHIIDDAGLPGALATRSFDGRGVPSSAITLVREGHMGGVYLGVDEAQKRGVRPTGHFYEDGRLWTGNLLVRAGRRSRNMLFPELGEFVVIDDFLVDESSATTVFDRNTGAIDVKARVFVRNEEEAMGFAGIHRFQTNLGELFSSVIEMANDQERHGQVDSASWILQGPWFAS